MTRTLKDQASRFVVVGVLNTVGTYALFIGLATVLPAGVAYTIAFALGLLWVVLGTSRVVFDGGGVGQMCAFGLWYVMIYAIGRAIVEWLDPQTFVHLVLTSGVLMLVTVPLSFVGGRIIFSRRPKVRTTPAKGSTK